MITQSIYDQMSKNDEDTHNLKAIRTLAEKGLNDAQSMNPTIPKSFRDQLTAEWLKTLDKIDSNITENNIYKNELRKELDRKIIILSI